MKKVTGVFIWEYPDDLPELAMNVKPGDVFTRKYPVSGPYLEFTGYEMYTAASLRSLSKVNKEIVALLVVETNDYFERGDRIFTKSIKVLDILFPTNLYTLFECRNLKELVVEFLSVNATYVPESYYRGNVFPLDRFFTDKTLIYKVLKSLRKPSDPMSLSKLMGDTVISKENFSIKELEEKLLCFNKYITEYIQKADCLSEDHIFNVKVFHVGLLLRLVYTVSIYFSVDGEDLDVVSDILLIYMGDVLEGLYYSERQMFNFMEIRVYPENQTFITGVITKIFSIGGINKKEKPSESFTSFMCSILTDIKFVNKINSIIPQKDRTNLVLLIGDESQKALLHATIRGNAYLAHEKYMIANPHEMHEMGYHWFCLTDCNPLYGDRQDISRIKELSTHKAYPNTCARLISNLKILNRHNIAYELAKSSSPSYGVLLLGSLFKLGLYGKSLGLLYMSQLHNAYTYAGETGTDRIILIIRDIYDRLSHMCVDLNQKLSEDLGFEFLNLFIRIANLSAVLYLINNDPLSMYVTGISRFSCSDYYTEDYPVKITSPLFKNDEVLALAAGIFDQRFSDVEMLINLTLFLCGRIVYKIHKRYSICVGTYGKPLYTFESRDSWEYYYSRKLVPVADLHEWVNTCDVNSSQGGKGALEFLHSLISEMLSILDTHLVERGIDHKIKPLLWSIVRTTIMPIINMLKTNRNFLNLDFIGSEWIRL